MELSHYRTQIDALDEQLWQTICQRMTVSRQIGMLKAQLHLTPLQLQRYEQMVNQRLQWARQNGLNEDFVHQLCDLIHRESVRIQEQEIDNITTKSTCGTDFDSTI